MADKTKVKKKKSLPLKILDIAVTVILIVILAALLINVIMGAIDPNYMPNIFGYQMYTIVTGSMDPYIEVGALVISKGVKEKQISGYVRAAEIDAMDISDEEKARMKAEEGVETLPFGSIIAFNADVDRDGKDDVVTHYFEKIMFDENGRAYVSTFPEHYNYVEKLDKNGNVVYDKDGNPVKVKEHIDIKSSAEIVNHDDFTGDKVTDPSDIRAIYVTHITWLGKFLFFLKTPYGIATIVVITVILIVGSILLKKVDKGGRKNANDEAEENDKAAAENKPDDIKDKTV